MSLVALPEPDAAIVSRREAIVEDLRRLVGADAVIADEDGRRAYETDALTAYRRLPLVVVLPASTEEVSRVLAYCHQHGIKVVARGAGTSLSGGALPAEDAVVVGISRMNRVLEIDYMNRVARVEVGITNLGISDVVRARDFFYAPDPSSQLACTLAGNIGMNSGGAHCLKYGVTTNNVLGLKMVLMDGEVIEIGGAHLDSPGYDLLGLVIGSEGQLGIATEATVRILRAAEGARPMLLGFDSSEAAGQCVCRHHRRGHRPRRHRVHGPAGDPRLRGLRQGRLPARGRGDADRRGGGIERGDRRPARRHHRHRQAVRAQGDAHQPERGAERGHLEGTQGGVRRHRPHLRLLLHGRRHPARQAGRGAGRHLAHLRQARPARRQHLPCRRRQPAPLGALRRQRSAQAERAEQAGHEILELCVASGGCLTGEHGVGIEKRDLMRVQFTETDLALQMRIKTVFDPKWLLNPAKVFPLEGRGAALEAA